MRCNCIGKCVVWCLTVSSLPVIAGEEQRNVCALKFADITIKGDEALAMLELSWGKEADSLGLKKEEVTVVALFQPRLIAPLNAALLALKRSYAFSLANDDLSKMVSALAIKDGKGKAQEGVLLLFFTGSDSKLDLRKSGKCTIPIRIEGGNSVTGQPAIEGVGVLSFALFREDDPRLDQIKSTKYTQVSNVVSRQVELKEGQ